MVYEVGSKNVFAKDSGIYVDSLPKVCTPEGAIDVFVNKVNASSAGPAAPAESNSAVAAAGSAASPPTSDMPAGSAAAAAASAPRYAPAPVQYYSYSGEFEGEYHTSKHSIRITKQNGRYLYQAWKQPKTMDEGRPDLMLTNGEDTADGISFKKGNLVIDINRSNKSDKELYIFINNVYRDHYFMYRDK